MSTATTNTLFNDLSGEESVRISGGYGRRGGGHDHGGGITPVQPGTIVNFDLNSYLFVLGAGVVYGPLGLTYDEQMLALETAIQTGPSVSRRSRW